jgi:hypothetical protein
VNFLIESHQKIKNDPNKMTQRETKRLPLQNRCTTLILVDGGMLGGVVRWSLN